MEQKKTETELFEVSTFDVAEERAESVEGGLSFEEAKAIAERLWQSGEYYGVQIVSLDPDNMEPIVWIESNYSKLNHKTK